MPIGRKTLRRSYDHAHGKAAITHGSVPGQDNHISLGQTVSVMRRAKRDHGDPQLLEIIEVSGLVTMTPWECQDGDSAKIVDEGGITAWL